MALKCSAIDWNESEGIICQQYSCPMISVNDEECVDSLKAACTDMVWTVFFLLIPLRACSLTMGFCFTKKHDFFLNSFSFLRKSDIFDDGREKDMTGLGRSVHITMDGVSWQKTRLYTGIHYPSTTERR